LAAKAGIRTPKNELLSVAGKSVLLSHRFDRAEDKRVPFISAMAMMGMKDGEHGSYPELVDALAEHGAQAASDVRELYRRMAFNVLISNVDDHLRNHGFLWAGRKGWSLSPAYDLNPTPVDVRQRILTTNISLEDGTCDIALVLSVAEFFSLALPEAKTIVKEVATSTAKWREAAATLGARRNEIQRMESAFEHSDLNKAIAL